MSEKVHGIGALIINYMHIHSIKKGKRVANIRVSVRCFCQVNESSVPALTHPVQLSPLGSKSTSTCIVRLINKSM